MNIMFYLKKAQYFFFTIHLVDETTIRYRFFDQMKAETKINIFIIYIFFSSDNLVYKEKNIYNCLSMLNST